MLYYILLTDIIFDTIGKCLICDTKTDSLATRNHPPFYLRSDTKSDSFATHAPLGSIGGTGDRGQGLGGTGVIISYETFTHL